MIEARVICDSIGEHSPRLTTFLTRYPKFCHAEHIRHRAGSYCVSSSRAVPVSRNLEEVRSDELRAGPVWWGREQKGMQSGEELDDTIAVDGAGRPMAEEHSYMDGAGRTATALTSAQSLWRAAALQAADTAEELAKFGAHKSIVNRILEPFLHVNVLVTSCEPGLLNFFGLRLDKAAQPEIRALAEAMWAAWNESRPQMLKPGQWHLPFIDAEDREFAGPKYITNAEVVTGDRLYMEGSELGTDVLVRLSVARCARLSYTSFESGKRSTIDEDFALYSRLVGAHPIHASPAEHQATPDDRGHWWDCEACGAPAWMEPEQHGNLPGWRQYRKFLAREAVAPLPEGYSLVTQ